MRSRVPSLSSTSARPCGVASPSRYRRTRSLTVGSQSMMSVLLDHDSSSTYSKDWSVRRRYRVRFRSDSEIRRCLDAHRTRPGAHAVARWVVGGSTRSAACTIQKLQFQIVYPGITAPGLDYMHRRTRMNRTIRTLRTSSASHRTIWGTGAYSPGLRVDSNNANTVSTAFDRTSPSRSSRR